MQTKTRESKSEKIKTFYVYLKPSEVTKIEEHTGTLTEGIRLLPETLKSLSALTGKTVKEIIREFKNHKS